MKQSIPVYEITCVRFDEREDEVLVLGNIERRWSVPADTAREWIASGIGQFYAVDRHHHPIAIEWDGTTLRCKRDGQWDDTLKTLPHC